jgi:hypothetical protein
MVLKSLFMRLGELSDDICNRLDSEITMKVTISNVPRCVNNRLQYFVLVALNHLNIGFTSAAPELDNITCVVRSFWLFPVVPLVECDDVMVEESINAVTFHHDKGSTVIQPYGLACVFSSHVACTNCIKQSPLCVVTFNCSWNFCPTGGCACSFVLGVAPLRFYSYGMLPRRIVYRSCHDVLSSAMEIILFRQIIPPLSLYLANLFAIRQQSRCWVT